MSRNLYPGRKIFETTNYFETTLTFEQIISDPKIDKIIKPEYQGSLEEERIESLKIEFIKHPMFLRYKNKIVIGELNNIWYILDGQHRLEMVKQIGDTYEGELHFCWYKFMNENDMRELFNSINKDSMKNKWFIDITNFKQIIITQFIKQMKSYYKEYFAKTKTLHGKLYTIEEFTKNLEEIGFFNTNLTGLEYYKIIKEKNNLFYNKYPWYEEFFNTNKSSFYKVEHKNIENGVIMSLKNNNFIKWLSNPSIIPFHIFTKGNKEKIPSKLREKLWIKTYGDENISKCPISFCNSILDNSKKNGWEAGHIISEYNGGTINIDNLKPICKSCNCSMGCKNWNEYDS